MKKALLLVILLITCFLWYRCSSVKPIAAVKDYDYNKIKCVGVVGIENYNSINHSGNVISTAVSEDLMIRGLKVTSRKKSWTYIKEKEFQLTGVNKNNDMPQVLLYINIIDYKTEDKKIVPITIEDKGSIIETKKIETGIKEEKPQEKYDPLKNKPKVESDTNIFTKTETVTTEKKLGKTTHTYKIEYFEAKVALNLKMVDVETGKVLWISSSSYSSLEISYSVKGAAAELLLPLDELLEEK